MGKDELHKRLYFKMEAEQKQFRNWLLTQPPAEILNHACEYIIREDLLAATNEIELTEVQLKALLNSPSPLADVYKEWEKAESHYIDDLKAAIRNRGDYVIALASE